MYVVIVLRRIQREAQVILHSRSSNSSSVQEAEADLVEGI